MTVFVLLLALQEPPTIDQAKVDLAVQRGVAWLKANAATPHAAGDQLKIAPDPLGRGHWSDVRELVLLAMWHAGVRQPDDFFAANFKKMMEEPPAFTYRTAVQAMLLEEIDPVKYQERLRECAQVLVDNQCVNGQWDYGPAPIDVAGAGAKKTKVEMPGKAGAKPAIKKRRDGPGAGDHSNSQYAALGLRACRDAGIELPREVLERAASAWRKFRLGTGWCYKPGGGLPRDRIDSGSMAAGAAGSLVIYDHLLGRDWEKDEDVARAVTWLVDHWSVTVNPQPVPFDATLHALYYLYGIERLGRLTGKDRIGTHDWYAEGAKALLDGQKEDGSWLWWENGSAAAGKAREPQDSCFAILFLTRGTKGLVPSTATKKNP